MKESRELSLCQRDSEKGSCILQYMEKGVSHTLFVPIMDLCLGPSLLLVPFVPPVKSYLYPRPRRSPISFMKTPLRREISPPVESIKLLPGTSSHSQHLFFCSSFPVKATTRSYHPHSQPRIQLIKKKKNNSENS